MASIQFIILAILTILLPRDSLATQYIVGDDIGWTVLYNYQEWAKGKVFRVGDQLVFQYDRIEHNVFKVNGTEFEECIVPPANEALDTGNDTIALTTPGNKWYICGIPTHCFLLKQKLAITVVSDAPMPPSPSAAYGVVTSGYQIMTMILMVLFTLIIG